MAPPMIPTLCFPHQAAHNLLIGLFGPAQIPAETILVQLLVGLLVPDNRMTNNLMRRLEGKGVPTHYVEELSDRETVVKKVSIVPLEVIIRNISAGSFAKQG